MLCDKIAKIKKDMEIKGHPLHDLRFNRQLVSLNCQLIDYTDVLQCIRNKVLLNKYRKDWTRMYKTFKELCSEVQTNQNSRRLVTFNTTGYSKEFQCFNLIQFIMEPDGTFDCIVYQRSADLLQKVEDDLMFFGYIIDKFERYTFGQVSSLKVCYGNIHFDTKK